jgi:tripartite-type tricarboxylate transporter receptor subunit TctC
MIRKSCLAMMTALLAAAMPAAHAQKYPDHPIRLVVPYAPGGSVDILGRLLAAKLSENTGQQVIVENKGGGGATIGTALVAKAPADGYTLLLADIAFGANPALMSKLPYDSVKDFAPVALVAMLPSILVVDPALPAGSAKELVALAKASPGKLNYSSAGVGSMNYLAGELFKAQTGIDVVHVPYQSGGQAIAAILGGQTQMVITTIPPVLQHVKSGKVKALALSGGKRQASLPDVPTFAEAGFAEFDVSLWQGVLVPAGTPPDIIARLNAEVNRALAAPDVRARIAELGADPAGGTPEQFTGFINGEMARWGKLIKPGMRLN